MKWSVSSFGELSNRELYELLKLRADIFVVEQECAYADPDGKDQQALHLLGYEGEELAAYARIFGPGDYLEQVSIGRVAVKEAHRGRQLGKKLMLRAMEAVKEAGLRIPRDVSVIGFDDIEISGYFGLTTVRHPLYESGLIAADLVIEHIRDPGCPPRTVEQELEVIVRSTTGPPPDR